jgi:2-iminobutanoate/2-iminopropanoate deaminase
MARRERIAGPGIPEHTNPFPACVKIGNLVFSAAIGGDDPDTHDLPEDPEAQIRNVFRTMRNMLRAAGGSPENVAKITVYVHDRSIRPQFNPHWIEMFPDEDDRPVRHFLPSDMPSGRHIQVDFVAVL